MATVYKRAGKNGTGRWCIRYSDPGGKDIRKVTTAKTKREAEAVLAAVLREIADDTYTARQRQREIRFFEICEDFMVYSRAHKRSWLRDEDSIKVLKEFLGDCYIREITPARLEEYILHRKQTNTVRGRPPRPATINRDLACIRTMFNRAIQNGKLDTNPVQYIKFLKENNVRDQVLSQEEFERLLSVAPEHVQPILIAAHDTGMRAGEIFGLKWEQVDLHKGIITLQPEDTKTNEGRKVPISPRLLKVLHRMPRSKKTPTVFMYHGRCINSIKKSFNTACKRAGVEGFVFHDFRHTFVTNMRRAGVQDRVIMAITGHKTMSAFMRYDTVGEIDLQQAINRGLFEIPGTNLAHLDRGEVASAL